MANGLRRRRSSSPFFQRRSEARSSRNGVNESCTLCLPGRAGEPTPAPRSPQLRVRQLPARSGHGCDGTTTTDRGEVVTSRLATVPRSPGHGLLSLDDAVCHCEPELSTRASNMFMNTTAPTPIASTEKHPGRPLTIALWVVQLGLALMFFMAGGKKLAGDPMMVGLFDTIGIGQWFRYLTG